MRVLCVGGSSLLGKALLEAKPDNVDLYSTWFTHHTPDCVYQLDVSNQSQISYVFEKCKPEVVIHCAAVGSVDYTENHYSETYQANVSGLGNVLRVSRNTLFVYISTNAVFSGNEPPYSEEMARQPINAYGRIKRDAENLVMVSRNWLIIRPFLMYGYPYPGGRLNWLVTILDKLGRGETVKLVNDTYWQPSLSLDVAQAIWKLIELGKKEEIYHVAADDRMTLYEFGLKVVEFYNQKHKLNQVSPEQIQPISSSELKGIAPRPVDTTFKLDKIHELGIRLRSVEEGLKALK